MFKGINPVPSEVSKALLAMLYHDRWHLLPWVHELQPVQYAYLYTSISSLQVLVKRPRSK